MILSEKFEKNVRHVCVIIESLVKPLKTVDHDNILALPIINEAIDIVKMAINKPVKHSKKIWRMIDNRWYNKLHCDLQVTSNLKCYM